MIKDGCTVYDDNWADETIHDAPLLHIKKGVGAVLTPSVILHTVLQI